MYAYYVSFPGCSKMVLNTFPGHGTLLTGTWYPPHQDMVPSSPGHGTLLTGT